MNKHINRLWIACFILFVFANGLWVLYQRNTSLIQSFESIQSKIILEYAYGSDNISSITSSEVFQQYLSTRNRENREAVTEMFAGIMRSNPRYDQLRFLNDKGEEIIRLDRREGEVVIISADKLQNKSNRYYFLDTMKLKEHEIYVSPLDLNVENGKIEQPVKPTVRMSTPVFVEADKVGMIIINYNATEILQSVVRDATKERPYLSISLLNSDGFYIYNDDSTKTWGFMYPDRSDQLFYNDYPSVWTKIVNNDFGRVLSLRDGLFLFNKVYPIQVCQRYELSPCELTSYFSRGLSTKDYYLIVVGNASISEVVKQVAHHILLPSVLMLFGILLLKRLFLRKSIFKS